jgi:hypothetical protein
MSIRIQTNININIYYSCLKILTLLKRKFYSEWKLYIKTLKINEAKNVLE